MPFQDPFSSLWQKKLAVFVAGHHQEKYFAVFSAEKHPPAMQTSPPAQGQRRRACCIITAFPSMKVKHQKDSPRGEGTGSHEVRRASGTLPAGTLSPPSSTAALQREKDHQIFQGPQREA